MPIRGESLDLISDFPIASGLLPSLAELIRNGSKCTLLPPTGVNVPLWPWILWNLWNSRNKLVFENKDFTAQEIINKSIKDAKEWSAAQTDQVAGSRLATSSGTGSVSSVPSSVFPAWNSCV